MQQNTVLINFIFSLFQQIMDIGDVTNDGHMSFEEFVDYVTDHEKKLWIVFKSVDLDNSGELVLLDILVSLHVEGSNFRLQSLGNGNYSLFIAHILVMAHFSLLD